MQIKNLITGTTPIIVHAPGGPPDIQKHNLAKHHQLNPTWKTLLKNWHNTLMPAPGPNLSREMTIITWNTFQKKSILELSLDKLGVPYHVLGQGHTNWSNPLKLDLAVKFLSSVNTPYVLALDAFDVLVLDHPVKALERFKKMDCDILFNAEHFFYPHYGNKNPERYITDSWKHFQEKIGFGHWPFVNAGACIAKTDAYIKFARDCWSRDVENLIKTGQLPRNEKISYRSTLESDQLRVQWCFMDWYPRVQADCQNRIFINTIRLSRKDILISRPAYKMPFEWTTILTDHARSRLQAGFKTYLKPLLNKTRTLRDHLGLRRSQWKNDNRKT